MADISRELVQDQTIPPQLTERVVARRITIPRGAETGAHHHNGPVFGVVLSGVAHVQVDGGELQRIRSGEVFFEPGDTLIDRFDGGDDELVFLAWFPVPDGVEPELLRP